MKQTVMVGVDVSKSTLDIYVKPSGTFLQIANTVAGFKKLYAALHADFDTGNVLVVMEHTGQYSYRFEAFLQARSIGYCKVAALQIKRSLGVTRGKNDKIDAQRIAEYGWLRRELLQADEPLEPAIVALQSLLRLRSKLVRDRAGYMGKVKEMLATGNGTAHCFAVKSLQRIVRALSTEITQVEQQLKVLIQSTEALHTTSELLQSIRGVGWIVAASMICYTANFKKFTNARKFNCYAGIAPFTHQSGSSIRGRSRISHLANKEAKTLLNLAAFTAIRHDNELKQYYQRRVAEGKRKMSCINIVRAKIVSRMFAVIKRQSPYYQLAA